MLYKGYRIEKIGTYSGFKIQAEGRGTIPTRLTGQFTNLGQAKQCVDIYLNSLVKSKKVRKDDQKEDQTRDT